MIVFLTKMKKKTKKTKTNKSTFKKEFFNTYSIKAIYHSIFVSLVPLFFNRDLRKEKKKKEKRWKCVPKQWITFTKTTLMATVCLELAYNGPQPD